MDLDVGERRHRLIAQRGNEVRRLRLPWRCIVAGRAADRTEERGPVGNRALWNLISLEDHRPGWRRSQEAHEVGKCRYVIENRCLRRKRRVGGVFRVAGAGEVQTGRWQPEATGPAIAVFARQRTVLWEQLIADPHLHVVGFPREDVQRLVLRLPTEPADRAVVAVVVEGAGYAKAVVEVV